MFTLLVDFADHFSVFNVFRYITFRTGGALITSALIVFIFGPAIINSLRLRQGKGQPIRADGPQTHFKKAGTPTMGGLMILTGLFVAVLLWGNLRNPYVWIVLFVTAAYGAIGFLDVTTAYVTGNVATLITHVPGGIGVLEATVMHLVGEQKAIGALIAFRVIYFLIPLAIGLPTFLGSEVYFRGREPESDKAPNRREATMPS